MKKLLFISFAFITGTSFAQTEASDVAVVNAEIVAPISITNENALDFGRIAVGSTEGEIKITPEGERTGPVGMLMPSVVSAASFYVNAANEYSYMMTISGSPLSLEGSGSDAPATSVMEVAYNHDKGDEKSFVGTGNLQEFKVGGTLKVQANQAPGQYSGDVTMTVVYE